mmetsp:Transcript_63606/g.186627  ORF Transcript_63606/g.186627 Transcript_63606/m.186627 type:complete len:239 (+) Transcript_63606:143-859(+)
MRGGAGATGAAGSVIWRGSPEAAWRAASAASLLPILEAASTSAFMSSDDLLLLVRVGSAMSSDDLVLFPRIDTLPPVLVVPLEVLRKAALAFSMCDFFMSWYHSGTPSWSSSSLSPSMEGLRQIGGACRKLSSHSESEKSPCNARFSATVPSFLTRSTCSFLRVREPVGDVGTARGGSSSVELHVGFTTCWLEISEVAREACGATWWEPLLEGRCRRPKPSASRSAARLDLASLSMCW